MSAPVLRVEHLTTAFHTELGPVRAVDDVSFDLAAGRTLALIGESGSGKSVTAQSILRLIPEPPGAIERGHVVFEGRDLMTAPERHLRSVRGAGIAMVFQAPMTSLNPAYTVGAQIVEVLRLHRRARGRAARARAVELLEQVGVPAPGTRVDAFPHELSAGMRQRIMIAMALACDPRVLIADAPTTALDVTSQAQILDRLRALQAEQGMGVVFITHDLGIVAELAHDVAVMYAGRIVEQGSVEAIFAAPQHPYTRALLGSLPPLDASRSANRPRRLPAIEGIVPNLMELGRGCRFAERCALRAARRPEPTVCRDAEPDLVPLAAGGAARCHFPGESP
ncbi:MAG: ABC transporter ATP-binding protein [Polyangiaceae bacterium]|nr:ABC transporter ATP-binding protein [Polyangiaceae bacterium]